ncbi:MAG: hypothetical protein HSCHL_0345 [Hydrogenibacillus schlegelii]|uniref:Uncharacterized protein n=1 Tax=Hydrogenibacillus schlegelii TaxID=1484 RepID=A0A2T5GE21_HYDSH|nr:MAG: hypothetical protein HSCHL_0345 [Hydrogenibacillus schlegelii]
MTEEKKKNAANAQKPPARPAVFVGLPLKRLPPGVRGAERG